jgi:TetR/AcrR family transcriptional regulator, cholesterol catabolism regulator
LDETHISDARERVLSTAERLFAQRGYTAVTLRDIAAEVGIRHTSLYHHVPGGKEELFVEVTERTLNRHRAGLTQAISAAGSDVRQQLYAASDWLLAQPPMDLIRMSNSDMPAIDKAHAHRLSQMAYDSMMGPIEAALEQAQARNEIAHHNLGLIAGGLLGMIESLHALPEFELDPGQRRSQLAHELIDVLLDGLWNRSGTDRNH